MEPNQHDADKPRLALLTLYDTVALGGRSLHATLVAHGYDCDLILFGTSIGCYGFKEKKRFYDRPSETEYALLRELLVERRPQVLGISFRSFAWPFVKRIAEIAREEVSPLLIFGGTHPTLLPEECLEVADIVCVGEGEGAMLEVARLFPDLSALTGVPNLWMKKDGEVIRNPLRPLISHLDSLPFPVLGNQGKFTIENDKRMDKDVYLGGEGPTLYCLAGSRGCPFSCDFCSNSVFRSLYHGLGKFVRKRSPENVIAELKRAKEELDLRAVAFMDEIFSLDPEWGKRVGERLKEEIALPLIVDLHPAFVKKEMVQAMKEAGLVVAHVGVQSGSERSRRLNYHRPETNAEILSAAHALHEERVSAYFDFIFDNPYEDETDLRETLELILQLPRPHNLKILSLCYFPRTPLTERALKDGYLHPRQLEHFTQKSITGHWCNFGENRDQKNAFFSALAWMDFVKFHPGKLALVFFSESFGDSFHLFPRPLIRFLSRSRFLQVRPWLLERFFSLVYFGINAGLAPLRWTRIAIRLAGARKWGKLGEKARERLGLTKESQKSRGDLGITP